MNAPLSELVRQALELDSLREFEKGTGRSYSLLQKLNCGQRRATPEVARALARHLRERSETFSRMADELEAAADKGDRDE